MLHAELDRVAHLGRDDTERVPAPAQPGEHRVHARVRPQEVAVAARVVLAVDRDELVGAGRGRARSICSRSGVPTPAISTSSAGTTPSTVRVACRNESRMSATESTSVPSKSNSHVSGDRAPAPVTSVTPANPIRVWERRTPHEKPTPRGRRRRPHPRPGRLRQLVLLAGLVHHRPSTPETAVAAPASTPAPAGKTIAVTEKDFSITVAGADRHPSPAPTRSSSPTRARRRTTSPSTAPASPTRPPRSPARARRT